MVFAFGEMRWTNIPYQITFSNKNSIEAHNSVWSEVVFLDEIESKVQPNEKMKKIIKIQ